MAEKNKYKFSIVIPVYKVEFYLRETLESVVNQTIGFEKNIQIILVNDGSPDNSEAICLEYKNRFPKNIVYVKQENSGVSAARNTGMQYIEGKYVNFLDSDDIWETDVFEKVYRFFEKHYDETDTVSCRIRQFDAVEKFHILDYKFDSDRVVDIFEEPSSIQVHVSSTFLKSEAARELKFDSRLKYGEDAVYLDTIIVNKGKYGIMRSALYKYRKRSDNSSAIQNQKSDLNYYQNTTKYYYKALIDFSMKKYGEVIPYVQGVIAYDIGWRITSPVPEGVLSDEQEKAYFEELREILSYVDYKVIMENRFYKSIYKRMTALRIKYNKNCFEDLYYNKQENALFYKDLRVAYIPRNQNICRVNFIDIKDSKLRIEGLFAKWVLDYCKNTRFVLRADGKEFVPEFMYYVARHEDTVFGEEEKFVKWILEIDNFDSFFSKKNVLKILPAMYFDGVLCDMGINYGKFLPNSNTCKYIYKTQAPYQIKAFKTNITIGKVNHIALRKFKNEILNSFWLIKNHLNRILALRLKYFLYRLLTHKEIWLITDRLDKAGDNGEAFYKYLIKHTPSGVKPYFVIGSDSEDAERLKKLGRVVFYETKKYKILFLLCKKIISSSANDFLINPFESDKKYLMDLINFDFVFLQHGVTKDDVSRWLHKDNKNIRLFITAGKREYDSIINGNYYYQKENVALTGFARFDELLENSNNKTQKKILVIPTWRNSIRGCFIPGTTLSVYYKKFRETEYFKFYNSLINNERLLEAMRKNGYKGVFCCHPIFEKQSVDFDGNDVFEINRGFVDYQSQFESSALMVTDYSSVYFDFGYIKKPVIYSQFDKEDFFKGHTYDKGYFSYEEDGFGPVCTNLEQTVDEIIRSIENGCKLTEEYEQRINRFYAFSDANNCKRILDAVLALDGREG